MILKETLTNDLISAGERFISAMNEEDARVSMGVWKRPDSPDSSNVWRLLLATPVAEAGGRLKCYEKAVSTFNSHSDRFFPLGLFDIEIESLESASLEPFKKAAMVGSDAYLKPDYSSSGADGFFSGDSFVYFPE